MSRIKLVVKGMHCKSCKMLIEDELEEIGATEIKITVDEASKQGSVECETDKTKDEIIKLIESQGEYSVEK